MTTEFTTGKGPCKCLWSDTDDLCMLIDAKTGHTHHIWGKGVIVKVSDAMDYLSKRFAPNGHLVIVKLSCIAPEYTERTTE
jgi:hypothetical protein